MTNEEADAILERFEGTKIQRFAREFDRKVVRERGVTESRARLNVIYRHAFSVICYNLSTLPVVQIDVDSK